jgi:hypothetical protein
MTQGPRDAISPEARRYAATAWQVFAVSLCAAAMLLLLCARELPAWAEQHAPDFEPAAAALDSALAQSGLSAPYDTLHHFMERLAEPG